MSTDVSRVTEVSQVTKVSLVPHTHWDREWYEPFQRFRLRLVDLMDDVVSRASHVELDNWSVHALSSLSQV